MTALGRLPIDTKAIVAAAVIGIVASWLDARLALVRIETAQVEMDRRIDRIERHFDAQASNEAP